MLGRHRGIWLDMATRSQNQGMLGHPGENRMILPHGQSCSFTTNLPKMAPGGNACGSRSSYERLGASSAQTRGSGDTNW